MNARQFPKGRAIALNRNFSLLFKYPQVYTNLDFKNLPTMPLEHRPGFDKVATSQHACGPPAHCWQQFTESEKLVLLDNLYSTVLVDKMTVFGVRPPEL